MYAKKALVFAMNEASLVDIVGGKFEIPYPMYPLNEAEGALFPTILAVIFAVARWSE